MTTDTLKCVQFSRSFFTILLLVLSSYGYMAYNGGCNEAVCGPIVSKCMLTQSCKCDAKNISCSKDCFYCLDKLYLECCSCVEMCPKVNESDSYLSMKSHVEDLAEPFPDLFSVLTEDKDRLLRWTSYNYPAELSIISVDKDVKLITAGDTSVEPFAVNCTVAYMSQCMSWNKCKSSCLSMGASSYRWFHDGCCECVGSTCLNYGINESRCLDCPPDKDQMTLEELNVVSKDSEKLDEEFTEDQNGDITDSLSEREGFDYMQSIES